MKPVLIVIAIITALGGAIAWTNHQRAERMRVEREQTEKVAAERRAAEAQEREEARRQQAEEERTRQALATSLAADLAALDDIDKKWGDAVRVANATARISLAGQVTALQAIYRETEVLRLSGCPEEARKILVESMGFTTQAFIDFMGKKELMSRVLLDDASEKMTAYREKRKTCL